MTKIRLIIPITGLSKESIEERLKYLRKIANQETIIDAVQIEEGPPAIESEVDSVIAGSYILKYVKEAEIEGYGAVIIWCGSDPAIKAARQIVNIPVIGPGEAMNSLALLLGKKPCCVTPDIPVLEMRKDLNKTVEMIMSTIQSKMEKGEGDVFYLGCLALWDLGKKLRDNFNVPVIDGAETSLKLAEVMVKLGLRHSRITYPLYIGGLV